MGDQRPIGVVIAASNFNGPTAFVIEMEDVFSTMSEAFDGVQARVLTDTENEILNFKHKYLYKMDSTHLWPLYLQDLLRRHDERLGSFQPATLIPNDLPQANSELHALLVLGHILPLDVGIMLSGTLDVRFYSLSRFAYLVSKTTRSARSLFYQLRCYDAGINFLMLLAALGHPQAETFYNRHPSDKAFAVEVVRHLFTHTDVPKSIRPSDALIGELFHLLTPRMRGYKARRADKFGFYLTSTLPVSSMDTAAILAKAHFAYSNNCFFVCTVDDGHSWQYLTLLLSLTIRPAAISSSSWKHGSLLPNARNKMEIEKRRPRSSDVHNRFPRVIIEYVDHPIAPEDTTGHLIRGSELYDGVWSSDDSDRLDATLAATSNKRAGGVRLGSRALQI
jgi:hypothetical protein